MPRARCTVIDRRKRQKPPGLRTIVGSPGQTAQLRRIKIPAQGYRNLHDEPPWFATLNLTRPHQAIAQESRFQGLGISSQFVGCVICVSCVSDGSLNQASRPLPTLVRGDFVSEVILIIRLPVRPSRLKAISMPTVLRNVWQRRNRPARAGGLLGHPAVLTRTSSPAAIWARRRSEALPDHVPRTAMISRTKAATGSASMAPSIAVLRLSS